LFPTSEEGMHLDIWPHRDHRTCSLSSFQSTEVSKCEHWLLPYGHILLLRGDTVHAGGYASSRSGTPRCHVYIHKVCRGRNQPALRGTPYDPLSSNLYRFSDDASSPSLDPFYVR
jgi:hypothetical protein